eukprot:TRINITY_DN74196_c0_g1_i1.p1 TRINITY_DN74196_c0_g1~~TRINITY_DN74196_c0_g1_i1.p1  ORF type:complete len:776 (-),score=111.74 TRINITY_DN74196_c0_g1_i1:32-2359(-)
MSLVSGFEDSVVHLRLGGSFTYETAVAECREQHARLCFANEVCPLASISRGPLGKALEGSHWLPIGDAPNDWLQIGTDGRTCWSHNGPRIHDGLHHTANLGPPTWGTSSASVLAEKDHVLCCREASCEDTEGWTNGFGDCQKMGFSEAQGCTSTGWTCRGYSLSRYAIGGLSWCHGGGATRRAAWTQGQAFNHPEEHCCACGGGVSRLPERYLEVAERLSPPKAPATIVRSVAILFQRLENCASLRSCTYYWSFLALLVGRQTFEDSIYKQSLEEGRVDLWAEVMRNYTKKVVHVRLDELAYLTSVPQFRGGTPPRLGLFGHPRGPEGRSANAGATMLLYADSPRYYEHEAVKPFVRHLRCYADARGMRFVRDSGGMRVRQTDLGILNVSIQGEYYLSARDASPAREAEAKQAVDEIIRGATGATLAKLPGLENTLALNYAHAMHFGRIWALEEQLMHVPPGALVIYFDADVTIHPGAAERGPGLAEMLMAHPTLRGDEAAHVFIADTWPGIECVNSGFVAVRNTDVGRLFLKLWKEKLWWGSSWDQAALAETVLEMVGAEAKKLTNGKKTYHHHCLGNLVPIADATYTNMRYCDCWNGVLEDLVGSYRHRHSLTVGFVDPERNDMNFLPNTLFFDHGYTLSRMHLVPAAQAHFEPLVIHWAGLALKQHLMEAWLASNFGLSAEGCPRLRLASNQTRIGAMKFARRASRFGGKARHLRCCEKLKMHSNRKEWPWTLPKDEWTSWVHWWGCSSFRPVVKLDCIQLLGKSAEAINWP